MNHTDIVPETVAHSQRSSAYEQKVAQCVRYIKLLSCVLIVIVAICIATIGLLLWHIVRSVPSQDQIVNRNEFNAENENANIVHILEDQREMIRSLQLNLDQEKQKTNERFDAHGTVLDAQESAVKLVYEACSAGITQLTREVKTQEVTITDLETKLQAQDTQLDTKETVLKTFADRLQTVNETVTSMRMDDVRKLSDDVRTHFEDISKLNVVVENSSADIIGLRAKVQILEVTVSDLESKFQAQNTQLDVQESTVRTIDETMQNVTQTILEDVMKLKEEGRTSFHDILILKTLSENSSADIEILKTEVKNQQGTIRDFETMFQAHDIKFGSQGSTLKTYGKLLQNISESMTKLIFDDVRKLKEETNRNSDDILKLKDLTENSSTEIVSLQTDGKGQAVTIRHLEKNFEAFNTVLGSQVSAIKTNGDMLKNVNETMTRLHVNDMRMLKDDAVKRIEDIVWLKMAFKNSSADISSFQATVHDQEEAIRHLETQFKAPSGFGSTFTRWGRPDCPGNGTELVYSGYVGGGHYNLPGSAVNYLCLTKLPTWDHTTTIDNYAYLYGAEYKFGSVLSSMYFSQNLQNQEPPCAVCRSIRASVIMIPGTNVCTEGWTREYAGYLVAGAHSHHAASEFICVDNSSSTVEGSNSSDNNGKLLYLVRAECGSLKCPPYVGNREVTCVVCTQ